MEPGEQLGELWLRASRAVDDGDERRSAFQPLDDVRGEQSQLLVLVGRRGECARAGLLGHRRGVVAAHGAADELAEHAALVAEACVHRLLRDARLRGDRGDARAVVAALLEQLCGCVEHALAGLLRLFAPVFGPVARGA